MQAPGVEEVAADLARPGRRLPLLLGRQARLRPARVGVRLVVAHVTDRPGQLERPYPAKGEFRKSGAVRGQVRRRAPPAALPGRPAVGQPQVRAAVAAVLDEAEELAV